MLLVGLTGNIGSGKTTVARVFEKLSVPVYRADEKGRQLLTLPGVIKKVCALFGDAVLGTDGQIDRQCLAAIVFNDRQKLKQLNSIIHPMVREDFSIWTAEQKQEAYVIQEAAILLESGEAMNFDRIIVVTAPEDLRIRRVCARDGVDRDQVLKRAQHQMNETEKIKAADFVITNDGFQALLPQVLGIHKVLSQMAGRLSNHAGK